MHALRDRVQIGRQRLGIGGAQLRYLSPVEDFARQFVALLGEVLEGTRTSRPLPGLGPAATRQADLAEQDVADLLGATGIDRLAGELLDFVLQRGLLLCEFAGQANNFLFL